MTFWQAKSTLLATLTFSLVYFLNGRKPDKGNRKLALDIREQSQHQWVWTTAENFIIGNLGRCLLPPPRQATISHVLLDTRKRDRSAYNLAKEATVKIIDYTEF